VDVDAVTIDAYGTLVQLRDPVPALRDALAARGVEIVRLTLDVGIGTFRPMRPGPIAAQIVRECR